LSDVFRPELIALLLAVGDFIRICDVLILDNLLRIIEAAYPDANHATDLGGANRDYCVFLRGHVLALPLLRALLSGGALSLRAPRVVDPNLPGGADWLNILDVVLRCTSCCATFAHFLVVCACCGLDLGRVDRACSAEANWLALLLLLAGCSSSAHTAGWPIGSFCASSFDLHLRLHVMILAILLLHLVDRLRLLIHLAS